MLVVTLGTPASASTWIFNVVRAIVAARGIPAVSLSSDDAVDLLDNIPLGVELVLLKAHSLDLRLLRLIALANARLIVSMRDPRDSVVSQYERFGAAMPEAASDITRSLASVRMLPTAIDRLEFRYEDRFIERIDTIVSIARFLGLDLPIADAIAIQAALKPDAVRLAITTRLAAYGADDRVAHDPATQWHPDHVGDGRIGKWHEKLPPGVASSVSRAISPLSHEDGWRCVPIIWSREMFRFDDEIDATDIAPLRCDGRERVMVYGPYLHLPTGRWRATLLADALPGCAARIRLDVYLRTNGRDTVAECEIDLRDGIAAIEFDHFDHFEPIEVRVLSLPSEEATFSFAGVSMTWIRDATMPPSSSTPILARRANAA